ncbi:MAG: TonB-dependent receptor [Bryobacterales bacterium]|nr:TonB-dependent receptor [Bryobacterales bacterium]
MHVFTIRPRGGFFSRSLALSFWLLAPFLILAQDYRGHVQGSVSDPSGAAIPGASVTLRNINTGIEVQRDTDAYGNYRIDFVDPGSYQVVVEAAGFNRFVQENVSVQTRGDVTVNATLSLGEVTESVTVSENPVEVEFNTTTMAQTVNSRMLADLPVLARNPFTLTLLNPAVVNRYSDVAHRNPFFMQSSTGVDIGGSTGGKNELLLDGAPIGVDSRGSYAPPMDAVQEVTVEQNSVDAEFGFSAGGTMSLSVKSGTNELHGTAYYFGRNPALNALSNRYTRSENVVRNHVWGGTIGGPLIKNKLFSFFSYEGWQNTQPRQRVNTLPTELERAGDFSDTFTPGGAIRTIYDPLTTQFDPAANTSTRTPFANNMIPASRIDPTASVFMGDVWAPNGPGDNITRVNNFKLTYPWWQKYWNISSRTDWNISDNLKTYFRYSVFNTRLDNERYADSLAVPSDNGGLMDSVNAASDLVWTVNSTTVFNFRFSTSYLEDDYDSEWAKVGESGLQRLWGSNDWYKSYIQDIPAIYYPHMNVSGKGSFGKSSTWFYRPRKSSFQGSLSKFIGKHQVKFGAAYRHSWGANTLPNLMRFNFSPTDTASTFINPNTNLSGDAWASTLLGVVNNDSYARSAPVQDIIRDQWAGFIQDDIKLTRRVTLNVGLRYEYETAPTEREDHMSRYLDLSNPISELQGLELPAEALALGASPTYNGAWVFTDSDNRSLYQAQKNLFLPRLGVAVRLSDKTALRIGYARYAVPMVNAIGSSWYIPSDGYSAQTNPLPVLQGVPQSSLSNPFPADANPLIQAVGKSRGRYENLGQAATWFQQKMKVGINDRINFSVQRQLPGGIVTDLTYFINVGHNAPNPSIWGGTGEAINLNLVDPNIVYSTGAAVDKTVANPFYNIMSPETFPGSLRNQRTVAVRQLLRPYPQYNDLNIAFADGFRNRYQAIQLKAERAFRDGYTFTMAYNYSYEKNDEYFNDIDQYVDNRTLINSNNPRHRLSLGGVYELPFGKGKRFLGNAHPLVDAVLGGWSTSHIYRWNSGQFLRFGQLDVSGNPLIDNPTAERWFDTSVFAVATPYTPRTNPWQYSGLTGPMYWDWDSTLAKNFQVSDRFRLELRLEAYNLTNTLMHPNPNVTVTSSQFGQSVGQANYGREVQYTLRLHF